MSRTLAVLFAEAGGRQLGYGLLEGPSCELQQLLFSHQVASGPSKPQPSLRFFC